MSTELWITLHVISAAFWLWIAAGRGAEKLETTFASGCLLSVFAPNWSADGIRLFGWLSLLGGLAWFVLGLFDPASRVF